MELIGFQQDRYNVVVEAVPVGGVEVAVPTYDLEFDIPIRHRLVGELLEEAERRGDIKRGGDHGNPLIVVAEPWQGYTWYRDVC